jgi:hypothetical protein
MFLSSFPYPNAKSMPILICENIVKLGYDVKNRLNMRFYASK